MPFLKPAQTIPLQQSAYLLQLMCSRKGSSRKSMGYYTREG